MSQPPGIFVSQTTVKDPFKKTVFKQAVDHDFIDELRRDYEKVYADVEGAKIEIDGYITITVTQPYQP
jgi:hypothetical protein